jgi:predicted DNA-binding transcriptional regulator YafY
MRADRLLAIVMLLQRRGKMTARAIAAELEVSRRTVLRDIEALSVAGVPIYAEGGHGGGIALDENYRVSLTGLKEAEVRALFIASSTRLLYIPCSTAKPVLAQIGTFPPIKVYDSITGCVKDIGLQDAAESSVPKLFAALPVLHQEAVEHLRQRLYIDPVWWWHDNQPLPFWPELQRAVDEDYCIQVTYEQYDGVVVERVLEPYSLVAKASLWYLVARRDGEFRTYRISRFHAVVVLDSAFHRQPDFDVSAYWQAHAQEFVAALSNYTFTLRIDSRLPEARWNAPGRCQIVSAPGNDGWLTACFSVESLDLARMFILGLGKQAIIVEPSEWREAVLDAARAVLDLYKSSETRLSQASTALSERGEILT